MDGAARQGRQGGAAQALARVIYSAEALSHIERAFAFLASRDATAAIAAASAIREAVSLLEKHPLVGRPVAGNIRELVVSFGSTGYVALYRFLPARDQVRVLAIRHQRELDYPA